LRRARSIIRTVIDHGFSSRAADIDAAGLRQSIRYRRQRVRICLIDVGGIGKKSLEYLVRRGDCGGIDRCSRRRVNSDVGFVLTGDRVDRFEHGELHDRRDARLAERALTLLDQGLDGDLVPFQDDVVCPRHRRRTEQGNRQQNCTNSRHRHLT
jgi:hypothetical protein